MGTLIRMVCVWAVMCSTALAVDRSTREWPSERQKERIKHCSAQAGGKQGDERRSFMNDCLKTKCIQEAGVKGLKGDDHKQFLRSCVKN